MKTHLARLASLALSLYAVLSAGCFTNDILHNSITTSTNYNDAYVLQVDRCYLSPQRQLIVAAHGAILNRRNPAKTPYQNVWFEIYGPGLTKPTRVGGRTVVFNGAVKQGSPPLAMLVERHFVEIPFEKVEINPDAVSKTPFPLPSGQSKVAIYYASATEPAHFPEPALEDPWFCLSDATSTRYLPFRLAEVDEQQTVQPNMLVRVPVGILFDVVTMPFQFAIYVNDGHWPFYEK